MHQEEIFQSTFPPSWEVKKDDKTEQLGAAERAEVEEQLGAMEHTTGTVETAEGEIYMSRGTGLRGIDMNQGLIREGVTGGIQS